MDETKSLHPTATQINLRINEEEKKEALENNWRSCSGCIIDKRSLGFFTTLGISLLVISFCIVKLSLAITCEGTNTWMALLTFVLGVWIKSPTM